LRTFSFILLTGLKKRTIGPLFGLFFGPHLQKLSSLRFGLLGTRNERAGEATKKRQDYDEGEHCCAYGLMHTYFGNLNWPKTKRNFSKRFFVKFHFGLLNYREEYL
jgi:hypothetical protein